MRLNDDAYVRDQYRSTENLDVRRSVWQVWAPGHSPQSHAITALRDITPQRILEVGSGRGSLAAEIVDTIACEVLAVDSSSAMVKESCSLGVTSIRADVRSLPFPSELFDAAIAAWMLYHVSPLEQALSELARVLRPDGRLIAITNGRAHLEELWRVVGSQHEEPSFSVENGADYLHEYFDVVARIDASTYAVFRDRRAAASYLSSVGLNDLVEHLPEVGWPLQARGATAVFVADRPKRSRL